MRNTSSALRVVSVKLPATLDRLLRQIARQRHVSRSAVFREALEAFAKGRRRSVTSAAGDLVGVLSGPQDLSTSAEHLSDYGA